MKLYYIPYGIDSFCIIDENRKLLAGYGKAYEVLTIEKDGILFVKYSHVTKNMNVKKLKEKPLSIFNKWISENENDIPPTVKTIKRIDNDVGNTFVPF